MGKKVRWGILGCADIVERRFLPAMEQADNAVFTALASRSGSDRLERVVNRYRPDVVYDDYQALLEDGVVDAVYIPLPNSLHREWTVKAARLGLHVLCEKPMALTPADLDEMAAAARETGVTVMEAFACMHSPLYPTIRQLIAEGEIGELRTVESAFCYPMQNMKGNINANPALAGGAMNDVGCYNMLTLRQVTGREPVSVKAMATFLPTGVDATVSALFDMGDGVAGRYLSSLESASHRGLAALGSKGYLAFDRTPNTWGEVDIYLANDKGSRIVKLQVRNTYTLEIEQFGRCILAGEEPRVSLEESRNNARGLTMLREAIG